MKCNIHRAETYEREPQGMPMLCPKSCHVGRPRHSRQSRPPLYDYLFRAYRVSRSGAQLCKKKGLVRSAER